LEGNREIPEKKISCQGRGGTFCGKKSFFSSELKKQTPWAPKTKKKGGSVI